MNPPPQPVPPASERAETGRRRGRDVTPTTPGRRAIPTGSLVTVKPQSGGVTKVGLVVGPDQHWFPRPESVFVQVGDRVRLIDVTELTVAHISPSS